MTSMISVRRKKISIALTFVSGIASARVFSGYRLILYAMSPSRFIDLFPRLVGQGTYFSFPSLPDFCPFCFCLVEGPKIAPLLLSCSLHHPQDLHDLSSIS
jgi:hypothetical protein